MKASFIALVLISGIGIPALAATYAECLDESIGRSLDENGCALRDGRVLVRQRRAR